MTYEQQEQIDFMPTEDDKERFSSLMKLLADPCRLNVLAELLEQPSTQKELAGRIEASSGTMSRQMSTLEEAGLVTRERSHGPYSLTEPDKTLEVLQAAARLSVMAAEARLETAVAWQQRLDAISNPSA